MIIPDPKAPGEEGIYALDYSDALAGDVVAASVWTLPGGIAQAAASFTANETKITVSGGTDGSDYLITNTVTSRGGLVLQGFVTLRVRQPGTDTAPVTTRYAALADMVARFGRETMVQLTDTSEVRTGAIDATVASQALADADATIDGYIGGRYALPLANVPELLKVIACDIARYRLMGERPIEAVRKRFEDACAWLAAVASGKYSLGLDTTGALTPEGDEGPKVQASRRVFDRERLHEFLHPPRGGPFF